LNRWREDSGGVYAAIFLAGFSGLVLTHIQLLQLPYFWDEAGYYIPAARDLLLTGSLIPRSTVSNAHPPLVMATLALGWKVFGFTPLVTRMVMLAWAALALTAVFRLTCMVQNRQVAIASTLCLAAYPVFFAQSSLAHVDLPAAGLTFWALGSYLNNRRWQAAICFSLAALAKETAVLTCAALAAWEVLGTARRKDSARRLLPLLAPLLALLGWYAYHYGKTGFVFGNPEYFRYNVASTLQPLRIALALPIRLWQAVGYLHLWLLTFAAAAAMGLPALRDNAGERPRIALATQRAFLLIILAYVLAFSFIGGAELARYMLPAVPLAIMVCVSTLWRRVPYWYGVIAIVLAAFCAGWFLNPGYGFSPEDNLAYSDYIRLHQKAERFLEERYPQARVLTAWPASDELTRAYLGYVSSAFRVVRIEDFSAEQLMSAEEAKSTFDVALVFSTKYDPPNSLAEHWRFWQRWKQRFFDYHRDVPPLKAAQILGGNIAFAESRKGQWIAVIEIPRVLEARK